MKAYLIKTESKRIIIDNEYTLFDYISKHNLIIRVRKDFGNGIKYSYDIRTSKKYYKITAKRLNRYEDYEDAYVVHKKCLYTVMTFLNVDELKLANPKKLFYEDSVATLTVVNVDIKE